MTKHKNPLPRRQSEQLSRADAWRHVTLWALLGVVTLVLFVFTAVVDGMAQRGELRRVHPNVSGALPLHEELPAGGFDAIGLLFLTSHKPVDR